jgi:hypothetical protein
VEHVGDRASLAGDQDQVGLDELFALLLEE